MKKFLLIILFLVSSRVLACDCDPPDITEKFVQSEFVADVTIIKIYPNEKNERGYKADIKINKLYKGEPIKSVHVYGRSDHKFQSSCDILIPVDTQLIAYARKNKNGNYGIGMCSGLLYLNGTTPQRKKREVEILEMFKSKEIDFTDKISYGKKGHLEKNWVNSEV
ncbi:hypothetical protein [Autumnicola psychrophila]|uniref:Tissue inhibitor of metalloproteinase n=1 Tax=Autumnicola psychrophila TaxID=3075592 RepID=A0ABU3DMZ5_9FLAO|nr:hypothetical protein [Zunongwangia sp. F225]MDT0685089.1 hypothetical protein [Zunongwangia sp. F225]